MADALDSKSSTQKVCGFKSLLGHLFNCTVSSRIGHNATGAFDFRGFRRVCPFRGSPVRYCLHRLLHLNCTGFCTALIDPAHCLLEIGFEGLQIVVESNFRSISDPRGDNVNRVVLHQVRYHRLLAAREPARGADLLFPTVMLGKRPRFTVPGRTPRSPCPRRGVPGRQLRAAGLEAGPPTRRVRPSTASRPPRRAASSGRGFSSLLR
jgi:hypothetical protein